MVDEHRDPRASSPSSSPRASSSGRDDAIRQLLALHVAVQRRRQLVLRMFAARSWDGAEVDSFTVRRTLKKMRLVTLCWLVDR